MSTTQKLEAIVIGSGFGGAVACCRLAQRWPGKVALLERGLRYGLGAFARDPKGFSKQFWTESATGVPIQQGVFDIRHFDRMDVVVSAGLGGGSLLYANVFMPPPAWVFDEGWPAGLNRSLLEPYYGVCRSVLGAVPVPQPLNEPARRLHRQEVFQAFAQSEGVPSAPADVAVHFGRGYAARTGRALPMGLQETNRYGATQSSCTYCGECNIGCNVQAKNTLDLNYLHVAEQVHGADIRVGASVGSIVPLNAEGQPDSTAQGAHGYRVTYTTADGQSHQVDGQRVVVAAGTLGTNELLLRCRDEQGTLPRLSPRLGERFSGNGDFVTFAVGGEREVGSNHGPVITQVMDHGLLQRQPGRPAFLLEDAAFPPLLAWYLEGLRPVFGPLQMLAKGLRAGRRWWRRRWQGLWGGRSSGSVAEYFSEMLGGDLSSHSSVLLFMGKDSGDGRLSVRQGRLSLDWPQARSRALYEAIVACSERFARFVKARTHLTQPTWYWPFRRNITVHPLGGCALADTPEGGVAGVRDGERGQLFGYQGLYVTDGALVPTSLGANPSATIAALAEWVCEDITGLHPDDTLGVPA